MDSGAETDAEATQPTQAASPKEGSPLLSSSADENVRETTGPPLVDRQKPSAEQRAERRSTSDENGPQTISGSFGIVNGEPGIATSNWTDVPIRLAAPAPSSYALPFAQASPSGNMIQTSLANASEREISGKAWMNRGAKTATASSATTRPASRQEHISMASIPAKASVSTAPAVAPVNQEKASTEQKSSGPVNGLWMKRGSLGLVNAESTQATTTPRNVPISSTAASLVLTAQPPEPAGPSGHNSPPIPAKASEQKAFSDSAMSDGAKPRAEASAPTGVASQQQTISPPSVAGNESGVGTAANRPVNRMKNPVQAGSSAPERGSIAAVSPSAIASAESWYGTIDKSSVSISSQTAAATPPAQPLGLNDSSAASSPRMTVSNSVLEISANRSAVSGEASPAGELDLLVSAPAAILVSSSQPLIQTLPSASAFQRTFASASDADTFRNRSMEGGATAHSDAKSLLTSAPATIAEFSSQALLQTRPNADLVQGMTPGAPDKKDFGNVPTDSTWKAQVNQIMTPAPSAGAVSSSSVQAPAQTSPFSNRIGPMPAVAAEVQISRNVPADPGVRQISNGVSVGSVESATISISSSQLPIQTNPTAGAVQAMMPSTSGREASENILTNVSVKTQENGTRALVSSPVAAPNSSAPPSVDAGPSSDRFDPVPVSVHAPEWQISASGVVNTSALKTPTVVRVSTPEPATISNSPSLPKVQATSSESTIQSLPARSVEQDGSANGSVETQVEAVEVTGSGIHRQETTQAPASENNSARSVAVLPLDPGEALPDQALGGEENGGGTMNGPPAASAQIVNHHAAPAAQQVTPQQFVFRLTPDITTPQQTAMPQQTGLHQPIAMPPKPLSPAAPQFDSVEQAPAAPADLSTRPDNPPHIDASAAEEVSMLPADLPIAAISANNQDESQPTGNAADKAASSASGFRNPMLAKTADAAASKTADVASDSGASLQRAAQNAPQSSQSPHADISHGPDSAPSAAESGAAQAQAPAQTAPIQAAPPEAAATHNAPHSPDIATRSSEEQAVPVQAHSEGGEAVAANSVNTAKLMQTMTESEMHVGMRSSEFGDISIRTSITEQQMVARISLDHSELSQAISAHVSTMQTKLGAEFGLNTSIEVHNLGSSLSGQPGQSSQRENGAIKHSAQTGGIQLPREEDSGVSPAALANTGNGNRLDIRA